MPNYVKRVDAAGIYNRFNLKQNFYPGINILFGANGNGKTTLLHILANMLNGDFERFAFLQFRSIRAVLEDGTRIEIKRSKAKSKPDDEAIVVTINNETITSFLVRAAQMQEKKEKDLERRILREDPDWNQPVLLSTAYFPAFRTAIEASIPSDTEFVPPRMRRREWELRATRLARDLFGKFVPIINYPSPMEISQNLRMELQEALNTIAVAERRLLYDVFDQVFTALSKETTETSAEPDVILGEIRHLLEQLEDYPFRTGSRRDSEGIFAGLRNAVLSYKPQVGSGLTAPILNVYRNSLEERINVQKLALNTIERYLKAVNEFLEGKQLKPQWGDRESPRPHVSLEFNDSLPPVGLGALSSGERQIVTLIYAATHMRSEELVLIDEPEISLHVDWQRQLLTKMSDQLQNRQIIVCTHSPVIGADHEDQMMELKLQHTKKSSTTNINPVVDNEEIPL